MLSSHTGVLIPAFIIRLFYTFAFIAIFRCCFMTGLYAAETASVRGEISLAELNRFISYLAADWIRNNGIDAVGTNTVLEPFQRIAGEMNAEDFKQTIVDQLGLENVTLEDVSFSFSPSARSLNYRIPVSMSHDVRDGIIMIAESYARSRLSFHSPEYAIDSIKEKNVSSTNILSKAQIAIVKQDPTIPASWLQNVDTKVAFRCSCTNYIYQGICDNGIMWLYKVDRIDYSVDCERIDAQEFNPALFDTFEKCRKDAESNALQLSKKRGLSKPAVGIYWEEMRKCLAEHGVKWNMPSWLNPDRLYD